MLAALGAGSVVGLAGCVGDGLGVSGDPRYESGEIGDVDGEPRSGEEMVAAEAVAEVEVNENVTPLESLRIVDHEFALQDDYRGPTVQGTVENAGDDRIEVVEVRVRAYDDAGAHLGRYVDSTGDLEAGRNWSFQVVVLESPADLAEYEITVLGTPT